MLPKNQYLEAHSPSDVRVKGTRVGLEHLIMAYQSGFTAEEVAMQFRTVTLEQIHGVLAFYWGNRIAVDDYVRSCRKRSEEVRQELERQPVSEVVQRLRQIATSRTAQSAR